MENLIINTIDFEMKHENMAPFKMADLSKLTGLKIRELKRLVKKTEGAGALKEEGVYYVKGGYPFVITTCTKNKVEKYLTLPFLRLANKRFLHEQKEKIQECNYKLNRDLYTSRQVEQWYRIRRLLVLNNIPINSIYELVDKTPYKISDKVIYNKVKNVFTYFSNVEAKKRYENYENETNKELFLFCNKKVRQLKRNALARNLEFDITSENLIQKYEMQKGLCYYSKLPLTTKRIQRTKTDSRSKNALSVDRLDSSKGYTFDNIVICLNVYNTMKSDLEFEEFKNYILLAAKEFTK